jgi:REP-associated tyrosine transposase
MEEIGRKHPIHQPVYEQRDAPTIVYITLCTKDRRQILANDAAHMVLRNSWITANAWAVGRYAIMPDHVHLFCAPAINYGGTDAVPSQKLGATSLGRHSGRPSSSLEKWIAYWKSQSARHWPNPDHAPVWQRHFWDRQLRRSESYAQKWQYVIENPVRAGLVTKPEDWPYQGELNVLRW